MSDCNYCGKPLGFWASAAGQTSHEVCEQRAVAARAAEESRAQAASDAEALRIQKEKEVAYIQNQKARERGIEAMFQAAQTGEFPLAEPGPEMLLHPTELCHFSIGGCHKAMYFPNLEGTGRIGLRSDGVIRPDGLLLKDKGTLYITSERVAFLGKGDVTNLPLKKLIQCAAERDVLHISLENRVSSVYIVLDFEVATAAAAAIQTLTKKVKSEPRVRHSRKLRSAERP